MAVVAVTTPYRQHGYPSSTVHVAAHPGDHVPVEIGSLRSITTPLEPLFVSFEELAAYLGDELALLDEGDIIELLSPRVAHDRRPVGMVCIGCSDVDRARWVPVDDCAIAAPLWADELARRAATGDTEPTRPRRLAP